MRCGSSSRVWYAPIFTHSDSAELRPLTRSVPASESNEISVTVTARRSSTRSPAEAAPDAVSRATLRNVEPDTRSPNSIRLKTCHMSSPDSAVTRSVPAPAERLPFTDHFMAGREGCCG